MSKTAKRTIASAKETQATTTQATTQAQGAQAQATTQAGKGAGKASKDATQGAQAQASNAGKASKAGKAQAIPQAGARVTDKDLRVMLCTETLARCEKLAQAIGAQCKAIGNAEKNDFFIGGNNGIARVWYGKDTTQARTRAEFYAIATGVAFWCGKETPIYKAVKVDIENKGGRVSYYEKHGAQFRVVIPWIKADSFMSWITTQAQAIRAKETQADKAQAGKATQAQAVKDKAQGVKNKATQAGKKAQ